MPGKTPVNTAGKSSESFQTCCFFASVSGRIDRAACGAGSPIKCIPSEICSAKGCLNMVQSKWISRLLPLWNGGWQCLKSANTMREDSCGQERSRETVYFSGQCVKKQCGRISSCPRAQSCPRKCTELYGQHSRCKEKKERRKASHINGLQADEGIYKR